MSEEPDQATEIAIMMSDELAEEAAELSLFVEFDPELVKTAAFRGDVPEDIATWRYLMLMAMVNEFFGEPNDEVTVDAVKLMTDTLHEVFCCNDNVDLVRNLMARGYRNLKKDMH